MTAPLADRLLDAAVLPGYSSLGYRLRGLSWPSAVAGDLSGADVLVTGASSGLGEAACEGLARAGARVHMLVRDLRRGEAARERVAATVGSAAHLELERCDVADLEAVREFARDFGARVPSLAVLVNNAGVLTQERERSPDGHELTF